jgi:hypothetical protein
VVFNNQNAKTRMPVIYPSLSIRPTTKNPLRRAFICLIPGCVNGLPIVIHGKEADTRVGNGQRDGRPILLSRQLRSQHGRADFPVLLFAASIHETEAIRSESCLQFFSLPLGLKIG